MRLIDADGLIDSIRDDLNIDGKNFARIMEHIQNADVVDAEQVVHAHWIIIEDEFYGKHVYCSNCHEEFVLGKSTSVETMRERQKRCFHCGAKMYGGNEDG